MGFFLSGQGSSGVVMGQDVGKVLPLLGQCLGTPLAEPHAMAVAFCGKTECTALIPDREAGAAQAQRLPQGRTGDALPADRRVCDADAL